MMPRLDGLGLVAALRAEPRTAAVPVLLLSARAGQEASIEGLHAGADDYLVKPFAAAELLARVRANIELARIRNHHARWRTALVDSLQEAFFVCDEVGSVIEINTAFTEILGYGPDGLPYAPVHPWWPEPDTPNPEAHQQTVDAFAGMPDHPDGAYTVPVTHRDGHRVWITASIAHAEDPDTGRKVLVGHLPRRHRRALQRAAAGGTCRAECSNWHKPTRLTMRCMPPSTSCSGQWSAPLRAGRDVPRQERPRAEAIRRSQN